MTSTRGTVFLVGAGPGDPGLITVRGQLLLRRADVIVHDRLIPPELLTLGRENAELIDAGKKPGQQRLAQDEIQRTLIDRARRGLCVVRLKGGDPFVFGRGYEELAACREAGVDCVVIPGVTSAIGGPAAAGVPVTARGVARSFAVVTAETSPEDTAELNFAALAGIDTVVVLMGRASLPRVVAGLIAAGRDSRTTVACIERATTRHQRVRSGTLGDIVATVERDGLTNPMITVVGDVAAYAAIQDKVCSTGFSPEMGGTGGAPVDTQAGRPCHTPLLGRRIVITRPRASGRELRRTLETLGASVLTMPLIKVEQAAANVLEAHLRSLSEYRFVVFTSQHAVRAFGRGLQAAGLDARALACCRVCAVGPSTARALARIGVRADIVPARHTGAGLAAEMRKAGMTRGDCVLFPRGDIGGADVCAGLRADGAVVTDVVVYSTLRAEPSAASVRVLQDGVDAVLLFSPSAARGFADLVHFHPDLRAVGETLGSESASRSRIACIGPTTATAARAAELPVDLVADGPSTAAIIDALVREFSGGGAHR